MAILEIIAMAVIIPTVLGFIIAVGRLAYLASIEDM
jgi:hypothetical protein